MRTYQHIIDTKAVRQVINAIPEYCVVRELTERDYGIDLMIELFKKDCPDKNGHDTYESTGSICYLQIKGTDDLKKHKKKNKAKNGSSLKSEKLAFSIDKKALLYVEKFPVPFFLTHVFTRDGETDIYFLWLQRYISDELDIRKPDWRSSKSITVYIPVKNDFISNFTKIESIMSETQFIQQLIEFQHIFNFEITPRIQQILNLDIEEQPLYNQYEQLEVYLNRCLRLNTLIQSKHYGYGTEPILNLLDLFDKIKKSEKVLCNIDSNRDYSKLKELSEIHYLHRYYQQFEADNQDSTVY